MAPRIIIREPEHTYDTLETYERIEAELCKHPWGVHWLTHGRTFPVDQKQWHEEQFCRPRHCYQNALTACLSTSKVYLEEGFETDIRYAEGLMVDETGIYMHAWCTFDGKVRDFSHPEEAHKYLYFGIAFDVAFTWKVQWGGKIVYPGFIPRWKRTEQFVVPYLEKGGI